MKTSDLTGAALDWAVAKCEGYRDANNPEEHTELEEALCWHNWDMMRNPGVAAKHLVDLGYSTSWDKGGPIIEREMLAPEPLLDTNCALIKWRCRNWKGDGSDFCGPTPLIAAMRCFVASKLGDEVDVPEELR